MRSRGYRHACCSAVLVMGLVLGLVSCSRAPVDVLGRWRSALDHQSTAPASWLALGDSITEGQGASSRSERWIDLTGGSLRTGPAGGDGYLPGWYAVYGPDSTWQAYTARTGTVTDESSDSLGLRTARLEASASQSYAFTGTSADVYYTSPGGVLAYTVDGGPQTTIDTGGAPSTAHRSHVDFPDRGLHTLTLSAVSGSVSLSGVFAFDGDEHSGVHVFDGAHSGYTTGQFVAAGPDVDPVISMVQPDLVTIELGVNDYLKDDATPAHVKDDLSALVDDLRRQLKKKPPSIVLVIPYDIAPGADEQAHSWAEYASAIRSLGVELSVGVLDMSSMGTAQPGGDWSADGLHPSDAGHRAMAQRAADYLSGR